jgi:N-acetylglucosaminyl-diphospho-decaprenol L-rhamnosyltransferase
MVINYSNSLNASKPLLWAIILNYNDADNTIILFDKIKQFSLIDKIVIVDNASNDNSLLKLKSINHHKILLIQSNKNGGYGYGNNLGLHEALKSNVDYVLIANPDVSFEEATLRKMFEFMKLSYNCIAVSSKNDSKTFAFKSSPAILDIFHSSILLNKLLKPRNYEKKVFIDHVSTKVYALPGSLVLFDLNKFYKAGFYDENIFLYHEEVLIGEKFRKLNFESYVLLDCQYSHKKSESVNKNIKSSVKLKNIIINSHVYFLKNYKKYSSIPILILRLIQPLLILELILWRFLFKILIIKRGNISNEG